MKGLFARLLLGGATSAAGAPIWLWIIGAVLLAMGGLETARRIQISSLRADVAQAQTATANARRAHEEDKATWERTASEDLVRKLKLTERRIEAQSENQKLTDKRIVAADAARVRADQRANSLQLRVTDLLDAAKKADTGRGDPAAGEQCQATIAAANLLADVQRRIDRAAGAIADFADRSRIAGLQCEADYGALTLKATPPP